ncbi:XRE family transcriptional regulator [Bacillus tianshenii]|nr:XRE family transcriptional regulator [Bacillus tianshenii]
MKSKSSQISSFCPKRLKKAREARGYTIKELAEEVGVTHQSISKYENFKAVPSSLVLRKICSILKVHLTYMLKPTSEESEMVVFFRSRAAATVKSKKIHRHRLDWLVDIYEYLDEIMNFPQVNIPKVIENNSYIPTAFEEIDEIALDVRKYFGLGKGPISNILLLLEKNGAVISRAKFNDYKIDACSKWSENNNRPFIFLGSDNTSSVRSRFDIAHELGHLILHPNISWKEFNKKENYKLMEKEADRFASSFLLPEETFGSEVYSSSLENLIELKKRWKVSIQAMAYRAMQVGIFTESQFLYIRRLLSNKNMLKQEPLDSEMKYEEPSLLKQSIELILEHNVKAKNDLIDEIGLSREDIELLANLLPGTLIERNNYGNIVSFKR